AELYQFQQNLQQETEQFLATTAKERIAQGKAQAAELYQFQQNLQQETEQFLATTAQERLAKANAQAAELRQFRQDLFMSVIGGSGL
ncbi:gas vesicle protein GvpC, partial [Anabaena sp. CS-542/02]|uniref:gas vesicle protein GvpC n=1 Tax=Anabaena sp. CS-542/02 TaxID=3021719 RepID=UPI00232ED2E1